jgi:amino acid transporter
MFSSPNEFIMISGVLLGLAFIIMLIYFVNKLFVNQSQELLVKFIVLIFTALVGVFIIDKVIAFKINLLNDEQNNQLFDLIKTLVLMVFAYYFGSKSAKEVEPESSQQE